MAFARFAIGRYLVGDPAPGSVLTGQARFDIFDPFASVEAALAVTDVSYSMPEGLPEFVKRDQRIFGDWRRSQGQSAAGKPVPKRPAGGWGGVLSAVWGLESARCPLPTISRGWAWMYGKPASNAALDPAPRPGVSASDSPPSIKSVSATLEKFARDELGLSSEERGRLVERLLVSFTGEARPEAERAHLDEVRRRRGAVRAGREILVDGAEAHRRVRAALRR